MGNSVGLTEQLFLQQQILKTLQELTRKRKKKKKEKNEKKEKGKNVPGKNLSKNSQCDGNDDQPEPEQGPSKSAPKPDPKRVTRRAAKKAAQEIEKQTPHIDGNMPSGDKNYVEEDSESDSESESEPDDPNSDVFGTACSEMGDEPAEAPYSRPMPSIDPVHYQAGDDDYCWVESFELDLNSKR